MGWGVGGSPGPKPGFDAKLGIWGGFGANTQLAAGENFDRFSGSNRSNVLENKVFNVYKASNAEISPCGSINQI